MKQKFFVILVFLVILINLGFSSACRYNQVNIISGPQITKTNDNPDYEKLTVYRHFNNEQEYKKIVVKHDTSWDYDNYLKKDIVFNKQDKYDSNSKYRDYYFNNEGSFLKEHVYGELEVVECYHYPPRNKLFYIKCPN